MPINGKKNRNVIKLRVKTGSIGFQPVRPVEFFRNEYRDGKAYLNDIEKNRNVIKLRVKTGSIGFQPVRPVEFFRNEYRDGRLILMTLRRTGREIAI